MEKKIGENHHLDFFWGDKATNSDEKTFKKLFELFYPSLCLYARRYITDKAIREDIVQEVFASLWENRKKMSINISMRNYLVVCVKNQCISYLRREGYMQQYMDLEIEQHNSFHSEEHDIYLLTELQALLENALFKLPEAYRVVFEMNRLDGKSYDEIAEILNISVRTAKRYKSNATEILKKELKDYLPLLCLIYSSLSN